MPKTPRRQIPIEHDVMGLFERYPPEVLIALDGYQKRRRLCHMASCQCHDCPGLRRTLLDAGLWEEVQ